MSHAPLDPSEDPASARNTAYREANARQQELLRNGVSNSGHERNCCYLNTGSPRFANVSAAAGLDHVGDGRAYAAVDWDHDGDVDLWATNRTGPRLQLMRNNLDGRHSRHLTLSLEGNGTTSNRDAIGARVEVILRGGGEHRSIKSVRAGEGFLSQSSKRLHFGLGSRDDVERVEVRWPDGQVEHFTDLAADRSYALVQGSGEAKPRSKRAVATSPGTSEEHGVDDRAEVRIALRHRIPLPKIEIQTFAGAVDQVGMDDGPVLINLWATWCRPCLKELVEFRGRREQLTEAGLTVIAASVDQLAEDGGANPKAAREFFERQELPFAGGFATTDLVAKFEAIFYYLFDFRRPWAVPTSLLIDRQGRLAVVYIGAVDVEQLLRDLEALNRSDSEWFEASLPFPGTWLGPPRHPNLLALVRTLRERGFLADAAEYVQRFDAVLRGDPEYAELLADLAADFRDADQLDKAQFFLERAIGVNANLARAHQMLVDLLLPQGSDSGVRASLEKLVALHPQELPPRMLLGANYADGSRWSDAAEQFRRAVEIAPEEAEAHYQLARSLQRSDRVQESIASYQRAVELEPRRADIRYSLATALASAGQRAAAIQQLRSAHRLQADSLLVLNGLAWLLATAENLDAENRDEAVRLAERAAEMTDHGNPRVLDTLASAYASAGEFDQAMVTAERAIELAKSAGSAELAAEIQKRLDLFRARRAYRE